MAEYVLSERAKKDLRAIADYTEEKWSEKLAEDYLRMLFTESRALADKPEVGWPYDDYRPGLRNRAGILY